LNKTKFDPKKSVPNISRPKKNLGTILMHWMGVKLADNFQIRKHSWQCLFHIIMYAGIIYVNIIYVDIIYVNIIYVNIIYVNILLFTNL